jgi:hypothetical protein
VGFVLGLCRLHGGIIITILIDDCHVLGETLSTVLLRCEDVLRGLMNMTTSTPHDDA